MPRRSKPQRHEVVPVAPLAPLLLSIQEAAAFLGVTPWTLRRLQLTRELPYVPIGRRVFFDPADLRELVKARKTLYTQTPGRRSPRPPRRRAVEPPTHPDHGPESAGDTAAGPDASAQ